MRKMSYRALAMLLVVLLIAPVCANASNTAKLSKENITTLLENVFTEKYHSREILKVPDLSKYIKDTQGTHLFLNLLHFDVEYADVFEHRITKIEKPIIHIESYEEREGAALLSIIVDCSFISKNNIPAREGIEYKVEIQQIENTLMITKLTNMDAAFRDLEFKSIAELDAIHKNFDMHSAKREYDSWVSKLVHEEESEKIEPKAQARASTSFSKTKALEYMNTFAYTPYWIIFKTVSGDPDCTNFVSQCLWYGYGGGKSYSLVQSNAAALQQLAFDDYKQAPNNSWSGASYISNRTNPSGNWMRVVGLYDLMTGNASGKRPKGAGHNNNQVYTRYTRAFAIADILQFKYPRGDRYRHSVIVSKADSQSDIRCAQHSSSYVQRALSNILASWSYGSDDPCEMRGVRPGTGDL